MPRKVNKTKTPKAKKATTPQEKFKDSVVSQVSKNKEATPVESKSKVLIRALVYCAIAGLVFLFGFKYKSLLVVAKVDNNIIYRWQLNDRVYQRYGQRTLDDLVTLTLIKNELKKEKVSVSADEINKKVTEIEKDLNGTSLNDALKAQNLSMDEFREQIYLQQGIDKLFSQKVVVSKEEVDDYLSKYGSLLEASDDASKRTEAEKSVKDDKMQKAVSDWLEGLKTKVKVVKYI